MTMALLLLLACRPDDVEAGMDSVDCVTDGEIDGDSGVVATDDSDPVVTDDTGTTTPNNAMVGDWLSEGDNLSDLNVYFGYTTVTAAFRNDGSYIVSASPSAVEESGADTYEGTYTVDVATTPGTIILTQVTPYDASAEGIWQVDGQTLTYEASQTAPQSYGYTPPTVSAGFGSTTGPNLPAGGNVQTYVRQ